MVMYSFQVKVLRDGYFDVVLVPVVNSSCYHSLLDWARTDLNDRQAFVVVRDKEGDFVRVRSESDVREAQKISPVLCIQVKKGEQDLEHPEEIEFEDEEPLCLYDCDGMPVEAEEELYMDEGFWHPEHPIEAKRLPARSQSFNRRGNPHYNNLPFYLNKKIDVRSTENKRCASCNMQFVANSQGLNGIYFCHKENYRHYSTDGSRALTTTRRSQDNMFTRWVCCNYDCITARYPYAGRDMFVVDHIKDELSPIQLRAVQALGL